MKRVLALVLVMVLLLSACGNQLVIDTNYRFDKAKIEFGGEVIEVTVDKWNDYEGDSVQIHFKDAKGNTHVWLTHYENVILMYEE